MRKIFISHSAKSADDAAYLEAIVAGLEAAGFEVWLDRKALRGGDDWNLKISNNLAYCQGAVVLISRQSLASFYVQYEISNLLLRWRRERDPRTGEPRFPLCPILLNKDVIPGLDDGFSKAVGLKDVDYVAPCTWDSAVDALRVSFDHLPEFADGTNPFRAVERRIADTLAPVGVETLTDGAAEVGLPAPPDDPRAAALHIARCLLTYPLAAGFRFLSFVSPPLGDEARRDLFHLAAPGWVSPEAAQTLRASYSARPPLPCILNAELVDFTPAMYLRRARMLLPKFAGRVASVKGVTVQLAAAQLRRLVRIALGRELGIALEVTDAGFDSALSAEIRSVVTNKGQPVLVAIPLAESDLDLIDDLCRDPVFAAVTFVALCKEAEPGTAAGRLAWLDPVLQPGQEDSASQLHEQLIGSL
ncbi:MAG TPA: toll/interleukin-1 receptor domain-containing protein [Vicinamibacterales bacterium]|nr:toll/interleukin-1 receptor domain-containing protein [Vicinamibacterales bacterium]